MMLSARGLLAVLQLLFAFPFSVSLELSTLGFFLLRSSLDFRSLQI